MNADVARKLLDNVKNDGYVFDTECIVRARKLNIPVQQVPSKMGRWAPEKIKSPMGKSWIHYDERPFRAEGKWNSIEQ